MDQNLIAAGWGDQELAFQTLVDGINADGGINGRQIEVIYEAYNPVGTEDAEAACLRVTEDNEVFAVVGGFFGPAEPANTCIAGRGGTILVGGVQSEERLAEATAPWLAARVLRSRQANVLMSLLDQEGYLEDAEVALVTNIDAEDVHDDVVGALDEFGVEPVEDLLLDAPIGDIVAEDNAWAPLAERIRGSGANTVLVAGNPSSTVRNVASQGLDVDIWALDSDAVQNLGSTVDLADVAGTLTTSALSGQAAWDDESVADCRETFIAANPDVEIIEPDDLEEGDEEWAAGILAACSPLALFQILATAAGADLTNVSFADAAATIGDFSLPAAPFVSLSGQVRRQRLVPARGGQWGRRPRSPHRHHRRHPLVTEPTPAGGAAELTAGLLAQEDELQRREPPSPLDRDQHLGAGEGDLSLRQGLAMGGMTTFVILLLLNGLDELESAALTVLGPDIADTLGISDGSMVFISVVASAFFVVGAVPLGWLADRVRRAPIIGISTLIFSAMVFVSGPGGQRLLALLGPVRRRRLEGQRHPRPRLPPGRHLPGERPRAHRRDHGDGGTGRRGPQSPARRRHRRRRRRCGGGGVALGVLPPRPSGGHRRDHRLPPPRTRARPVGEAGRPAHRGGRRRRAHLPGGRVRPHLADPDDALGHRRLLGPRVHPLPPRVAGQLLPVGQVRPRRVRTGPGGLRRRRLHGGGVALRRAVVRPPVPAGPGSGAGHGGLADPARAR